MRKRLITPTPETVRSRHEGWLEIERLAIVEITSEEKDYPVEAAFVSGETPGWRRRRAAPANDPVVFDQLQTLKRISLVFRRKRNRADARVRTSKSTARPASSRAGQLVDLG